MNKLVPVYPWPVPVAAQRILDTIPEIKVVEALPGGPGPILAIGKVPGFVCDAILVKHPDRVAAAVQLVTSDQIELVSMRETFYSMMGVGETRELTERVEVSRVRFE